MSENDFPLGNYLDKLVENLREYAPDALREQESDAIHDARVATRRLKAALDLAKPVLSKEHRKPFAKLMRNMRKQLGPIRDIDVSLRHLKEFAKDRRHQLAIEWLTRNFEEQRQSLAKKIREKTPPGKWLGKLGTWWSVRYELQDASEAFSALLAESLHTQMDDFARQAAILVTPAESSPTEKRDPHQARIAGKGLRYTLEMAIEHGHPLSPDLRKTFKRLQDSLGLWHDYVVLAEQILGAVIEHKLAHHQLQLFDNLVDLSRVMMRKSEIQLDRFRKQWLRHGDRLVAELRSAYPLTIQPDDKAEEDAANEVE